MKPVAVRCRQHRVALLTTATVRDDRSGSKHAVFGRGRPDQSTRGGGYSDKAPPGSGEDLIAMSAMCGSSAWTRAAVERDRAPAVPILELRRQAQHGAAHRSDDLDADFEQLKPQRRDLRSSQAVPWATRRSSSSST